MRRRQGIGDTDGSIPVLSSGMVNNRRMAIPTTNRKCNQLHLYPHPSTHPHDHMKVRQVFVFGCIYGGWGSLTNTR